MLHLKKYINELPRLMAESFIDASGKPGEPGLYPADVTLAIRDHEPLPPVSERVWVYRGGVERKVSCELVKVMLIEDRWIATYRLAVCYA